LLGDNSSSCLWFMGECIMKKLLLLLFSLMLSFNSYGEWTKTNEDMDGNGYYIDFETVNKLDNGYVVFWIMADADININGYMSSKIYWQGDCNLSRMKILSMIQYKEPMGLGKSISSTASEVELAGGWDYLPPDSLGYDSLKTVCLLADQSSMNNYQSKVLELIAEYESYEWGDDEMEQYTQLLNQEIQEEQNSELMQKIQDQEIILKKAWINNIAAEVKSVWNFPGAEDGWFVEVLVTQNKEGKVLNVKPGDNNVGNSVIAKRFIDSIERAIYKSSPLPIAPDVSVWDKNIMFTFTP
jgi:hypothetical protein